MLHAAIKKKIISAKTEHTTTSSTNLGLTVNRKFYYEKKN